MNTAHLFYALSQSICISIVQGVLVYALLQFIFAVFPKMAPLWKYRFLFGSLIFMLVGFAYAVVKLYAPEVRFIADESVKRIPAKADLLSTIKAFLRNNSLIICVLYCVGLTVQAIYLASGLYKIEVVKKSANLNKIHEWDERLKSLCNKMLLSRPVQLLFSKTLTVPFTAGFIKPIIYFPIAMLAQLSIEQTEAILLHELAHIKRNDYLINIIQRIIETVLFFNPAVWLFARSLKNEREYCCDDLVLHFTASPGTYARALLLIEESKTDYNSLAMAADGAGKHSLFNRIKRLNVMKTVNSNPKHKLLAIVGLVAVSLSLAWAMPADSIQVKKPKKSSKQQVPPPPPPAPPLKLKAKAGDPSMVPPPPPPAEPAGKSSLTPPPPPPVPPKKGLNESEQDDTSKVIRYFNSAEWKEQQEAIKKSTEEVKKYFESAEWKKQQLAIKKNSEELKKHFDSPQWKAQQLALTKHTEQVAKYFESAEWKAQEKLIAKNAAELTKHFDSPEWKAHIAQLNKMGEELSKKFDSPEFKIQMQEIEKLEQAEKAEKPEKREKPEKAEQKEKAEQ